MLPHAFPAGKPGLLGLLGLLGLSAIPATAFADIVLSSSHANANFGGTICNYDANKSAANGKETWYCASGITISDNVTTSGIDKKNVLVQVDGNLTISGSRTVNANLKSTGTFKVDNHTKITIYGDVAAKTLSGQSYDYGLTSSDYLSISGRLTLTEGRTDSDDCNYITCLSQSVRVGSLVAHGNIKISESVKINPDNLPEYRNPAVESQAGYIRFWSNSEENRRTRINGNVIAYSYINGANCASGCSDTEYLTIDGNVESKNSFVRISGVGAAHNLIIGDVTAYTYFNDSNLDSHIAGSRCDNSSHAAGCNLEIRGKLTVKTGNAMVENSTLITKGVEAGGSVSLSDDDNISGGIVAKTGQVFIWADSGSYPNRCTTITGDVLAKTKIWTNTNGECFTINGKATALTGTLELNGWDLGKNAANRITKDARTGKDFILGVYSTAVENVFMIGKDTPKGTLYHDASVKKCIYAPSDARITANSSPKTITVGGICCYNRRNGNCSGDTKETKTCLADKSINVSHLEQSYCPSLLPTLKKEVNVTGPVDPGKEVEFTITVDDPLDLMGDPFTVQDFLPPQLEYVNSSSPEGSGTWDEKHRTISWTYDDKVGGETVFKVRAKVRCTATNQAVLSGGDKSSGYHFDSGNAAYATVESTGSCGVFNAVEKGQGSNGRIYTKLVDEPFALDIVSLASEADTAQDAALVGYSGTLDVRVFAAKNAQECPDDPAKLWEKPDFDFSDGKGGLADRKTIEGIAINKPVPIAKVWMKAKDGGGKFFCSSDAFTIRPKTMALTAKNDAGDLMNTAHHSGNPFDTAGKPFYIAAKEAAYSIRHQSEDASGITANYGSDVAPLASVDCNFKEGKHRFECTYKDVGILTFPRGLFDDEGQYVKNSGSGDAANKDCRTSNTANLQWDDIDKNGQYGCPIPSDQLTAGRWIPARFALKANVSPSCSTLAYIGEPGALDLDFEAEAQTQDGTPTQLYRNGDLVFSTDPAKGTAGDNLLARLIPSDTQNGWTLQLADDAQTREGQWQKGQWLFHPATPSGRHGNATFARKAAQAGGQAEKDGPYAFSLAMALTDEDMPNIAMHIAAGSDCAKAGSKISCKNNVPAALRFGRLAGRSAYGSPALPLPVHFEAQYWNGHAWARNGLDNCSVLALPEKGDCSVGEGLESALLNGKLAATGHPAGTSGFSAPAKGGAFILDAHYPGNTKKGPGQPGDAKIYLKPLVPGMEWLFDPAWPQADACGKPGSQPNVSLCFGRCGMRQEFIYKHAVIAPGR